MNCSPTSSRSRHPAGRSSPNIVHAKGERVVDPSPQQRSDGRKPETSRKGYPDRSVLGERSASGARPSNLCPPPGQRSGGGDRGVRLRGAVARSLRGAPASRASTTASSSSSGLVLRPKTSASLLRSRPPSRGVKVMAGIADPRPVELHHSGLDALVDL